MQSLSNVINNLLSKLLSLYKYPVSLSRVERDRVEQVGGGGDGLEMGESK